MDASYSGDSIYIGSLSSTVPLTAAPVNTAITLTASPSTALLTGQSVTLTSVLSPYTVGPPNTTTNGDPSISIAAARCWSGTLASGVAKLTTTALPTGSDSVTAVFAGDSNYNSSTSNVFSATVSSIVLISSQNPSTYLQSVTFTTTVPAGKTGTISFFDGANSIGSVGITGTTASLTTSSLSVGSHNITSQYNTDISNIAGPGSEQGDSHGDGDDIRPQHLRQSGDDYGDSSQRCDWHN